MIFLAASKLGNSVMDQFEIFNSDCHGQEKAKLIPLPNFYRSNIVSGIEAPRRNRRILQSQAYGVSSRSFRRPCVRPHGPGIVFRRTEMIHGHKIFFWIEANLQSRRWTRTSPGYADDAVDDFVAHLPLLDAT